MIIDVVDSAECSDPQCVPFFIQGPVYDGLLHYSNLEYLNTHLKSYRMGQVNIQECDQVEFEKQLGVQQA